MWRGAVMIIRILPALFRYSSAGPAAQFPPTPIPRPPFDRSFGDLKPRPPIAPANRNFSRIIPGYRVSYPRNPPNRPAPGPSTIPTSNPKTHVPGRPHPVPRSRPPGFLPAREAPPKGADPVAIAKEAGFSITQAELVRAHAGRVQELSDEELEEAAGGTDMVPVDEWPKGS